MKSELAKRIVSGIVLAVAVLFINYWNPISFAVMCALGGIVLLKEWHALTRTRGPLWLTAGILYIGSALAVMIALRMRPEGMFIIYLLFLVVWAADIGGYIVGKLVGRHKIAPKISPGKSWEGLAGSIAAVSGLLLVISTMGNIGQMWWIFVVMGALIAVIGLAGDLFESSLKRHVGVKDSGTLIPGHGGLFDRVDALLPVALFFGAAYYLLPLMRG